MKRGFREAYDETVYYVSLAFRALIFWRRHPTLETVEHIVQFVDTRSKFVSQVTLYGYIRTRIGTRYSSLMEDDLFATSVNIAKWEIYLACLCDLAIYVTARLGSESKAGNDELRDLAIKIVETVLGNEPVPKERPQGFDDILRGFDPRARSTVWADAAVREAAFEGSLTALVEWAPVADELKINDVEILRFSLRFRWKKVRDQLEDILDADAVLTDWRG